MKKNFRVTLPAVYDTRTPRGDWETAQFARGERPPFDTILSFTRITQGWRGFVAGTAPPSPECVLRDVYRRTVRDSGWLCYKAALRYALSFTRATQG